MEQDVDYIYVQIKAGHPHAGEYGHIKVVDNEVTLIAPLGLGQADMDMVLVELEDCKHGTTACYATKSQIRAVRAEE